MTKKIPLDGGNFGLMCRGSGLKTDMRAPHCKIDNCCQRVEKELAVRQQKSCGFGSPTYQKGASVVFAMVDCMHSVAAQVAQATPECEAPR